MESRRRLTLSEQLSVIDSSNLRDLLKARDDDEIHHSRPRLRGETLTLASVLAYEKRDISSTSSATTSRTLLDIIRDEEESTTNAVAGQLNTWRSFKDRLLLRRAGAAWSASSDQPNSISAADLMLPSVTSPVEARSISVHNAISSETPDPETNTTSRESIVSEYNATTSAAPQQEHVPANDSPLVREEQPIRVSLMALLEQTDRQGGGGVSTVAEEAEEEEEGGDGDGGGNGGAMSVCCVCMVRHKGAAFIPCGHTFCRLCSRELWVSRGNCPLCNGFILEILDIF